jgi:hypothetical protein
MAYAERTTVAPSQTRAEIEKLLRRAKAERVVHMDEPLEAIVMFMLAGRLIRFTIPIAKPDDDRLRRQRWRALLLVIKAKLEAVESKITTVEEEFLAHVVMPDGQTVARWIETPLKLAYDKGTMPTNPLMLEAPRP